jgi:hypothetical protein
MPSPVAQSLEGCLEPQVQWLGFATDGKVRFASEYFDELYHPSPRARTHARARTQRSSHDEHEPGHAGTRPCVLQLPHCAADGPCGRRVRLSRARTAHSHTHTRAHTHRRARALTPVCACACVRARQNVSACARTRARVCARVALLCICVRVCSVRSVPACAQVRLPNCLCVCACACVCECVCARAGTFAR